MTTAGTPHDGQWPTKVSGNAPDIEIFSSCCRGMFYASAVIVQQPVAQLVSSSRTNCATSLRPHMAGRP
jgi:hypothetical protein